MAMKLTEIRQSFQRTLPDQGVIGGIKTACLEGPDNWVFSERFFIFLAKHQRSSYSQRILSTHFGDSVSWTISFALIYVHTPHSYLPGGAGKEGERREERLIL